MAARARNAVVGMTNVGASVLGVALAAVAAAFVLGGAIYRTDCISDSGTHTSSWGLEGIHPLPLEPRREPLRAHTLTRYVLGQVGLIGRVDQ